MKWFLGLCKHNNSLVLYNLSFTRRWTFFNLIKCLYIWKKTCKTPNKAIHARSLFPCQDSPGIKVKYTAAVTVKDPLVALMSANLQHDKTTKNGDGTSTYHFIQHIPMSTYLGLDWNWFQSVFNFFDYFNMLVLASKTEDEQFEAIRMPSKVRTF